MISRESMELFVSIFSLMVFCFLFFGVITGLLIQLARIVAKPTYLGLIYYEACIKKTKIGKYVSLNIPEKGKKRLIMDGAASMVTLLFFAAIPSTSKFYSMVTDLYAGNLNVIHPAISIGMISSIAVVMIISFHTEKDTDHWIDKMNKVSTELLSALKKMVPK